MTWGHAVSPDLVHWEEIGDALQADRLGTMYSGSGVVDHRNTSGFQRGSIPPMVVFYTAAGRHAPKEVPFTQAMAYSVDRGRSWTKYEGNPVVEFMAKGNRDPKVFWHEASGQWVMALYLTRGEFIFMGSKNLREWRKLSDVPFPDGHECPEFFELPVDGNAADTRWVFWEGGGRHILGRFDGEKFAAESGVLPSEWGANSYAGQTYNDVPDGRRILLTWMRSGSQTVYAGMPFNQQMSFPRELSLRTTADGVRLFQTPAREIEKLYGKQLETANLSVGAAADALGALEGELFDVELQLQPDKAATVTLDVRGTPITYSAASGTLSCLGKTASVELTDGRLDLRVLADRTSIEIFAAEGRYVMSFCFVPQPGNRRLALQAEGGEGNVVSLRVRELKSIWNKPMVAR
jgi:sucrose-6-phosphate hydrolase SacC (GH32 family)